MSETHNLSYGVPGMSCDHCRAAITDQVLRVDGVRAVEVDLGARTVAVTGERLDDMAVRGAIGEAGYEVAEAGSGREEQR